MKKIATLAATMLLTTAAGATTAQAANICFSFQDLETEFWVAGHKAITTTLTEMGTIGVRHQRPWHRIGFEV